VYCDLHQQYCENPQVTHSLSVLSIVFYSVLKGSDNDIVHLPSIIGILGSVHILDSARYPETQYTKFDHFSLVAIC